MRFVHVADVHLDTPFASRSQTLRRRLREAAREAFRRAVTIAIQERAHAFLIAGDLLDGDRLSFGTERFLLEQMASLDDAGIQVVYATGNHDPAERAVRRRALPWPPNVTIADGPQVVRVPIEGRDQTLHGYVTAAGHATARVSDDLSLAFPTPGGPLPEVAILHTQVKDAPSSQEHEPYAPSQLANLVASGYDYWALGHVHLHQCLWEEPAIYYPGSLQGRNPSETGPRGCLLVDLPAGSSARVAFRQVAPVRWEELPVSDLGEARHLGALVRTVRTVWDTRRALDPAPGWEWIIRVNLSGATPLWKELSQPEDRQVLEEELTATLGALAVEVRVGPVYPSEPLEAHRRRPDVLAEALRLLDRVREGDPAALSLEPDELAGFDPNADASPAAYLRKLMAESEGELLAHLLVTPESESES
jgi:DNA repair exonuclease SbcCD nuclease subunit